MVLHMNAVPEVVMIVEGGHTVPGHHDHTFLSLCYGWLEDRIRTYLLL